MYIYDEHKLKKENRKRRLFILTKRQQEVVGFL